VSDARVVAVVPATAAGMRLDRFLATLPGLGTRSQAKQLLDDGRVTVDGVARKASHTLRAGERVEASIPPPAPVRAEPEALPLVVLYEDAHLLAIDKPAGMVVHPAPGAPRGTVVNALLHRLGAALGAVGAPERPGIVHRLDRDTSGVLVVARTAAALEGLARQFRDRTLKKRYLALVHGRPARARGTVDLPIGRDPTERKRMSVRARRARHAVTHWEVVEQLPGATLLGIDLETGRTHQIRVHLAAIGHPVVGDRVYGRAPRRARDVPAAARAVLDACPRQALHAASLRCAHPITGVPLRFEAPLPPDLVAIVDALRAIPA
jgi:23S rRNA pseudouridine1911/1915/1917 synthase